MSQDNVRYYVKQPPLGDAWTWAEREFEAVERAFSQLLTPRWDDLRFPANSIDPTGLAAPATRIVDLTTYPGALSFAGNAVNVVSGLAQMPHAAKEGAEIHPHIHWTQTTASTDAVDWAFYYRFLGNVGDVIGSWNGPFEATLQAGNRSIANSHLLSSFPAIQTSGWQDSAMLCWYIQRNGNTDADNNAAILFEFDIHFQTAIAGGSIVEYPTSSPFVQTPGTASLVITGRAPTVQVA